MTTKTFLTIGGAIGVFYGCGFLFVPDILGQIYGFAATPPVTLAYRYFGVALLGVGLVCWSARDLRDAVVLRNLLAALAVSDLAGVLVSAWGASNHIINGLGWMNVAIYGCLLIGALYFCRALSTSTRAISI